MVSDQKHLLAIADVGQRLDKVLQSSIYDELRNTIKRSRVGFLQKYHDCYFVLIAHFFTGRLICAICSSFIAADSVISVSSITSVILFCIFTKYTTNNCGQTTDILYRLPTEPNSYISKFAIGLGIKNLSSLGKPWYTETSLSYIMVSETQLHHPGR